MFSVFKEFCVFRKKIPTVSEKVDNEMEGNKKSKKKKNSNSKKDSNANLEQQKMTSKKKKSKKKSSREEDSETKSEINLLSASTDPKIELDNSENERPVEPVDLPKATTVVIEEPKNKKSSKSKKKKSSRKSSVGSLKDQLADSHSSLRDFFPDTALKNYLQGLHVSTVNVLFIAPARIIAHTRIIAQSEVGL